MLKSIVFICLLSLSLASNNLDINVEEGTLRGIKLKNLHGKEVHAYLGIPYAKPPVGELRFKDPESAEKWEEVKDAMTMPDYCVQHNLALKILDEDPLVGVEDCLYLNVYKPAFSKRTKLPVIVFIPGGGFLFGGAKDYTHKNILDYDVILVIVQYRLGVFGFISTDEQPLTGNYGLKDQQLALKWIKKNIAMFKGDTEIITLMGESAGAASIHYHILSAGSKGLFNRVVMLSGNALCPWARGVSHRPFAELIGDHFGCPLEAGSKNFRECMLKIDARDIVKYHGETLIILTTPNPMVPRVDGTFLKNYPELLHKYQIYNNVDVVIGVTRDEGACFLVVPEKIQTEDDFLKLPVIMLLEEEGNDERQNEIMSAILANYKNSERFIDVEEMMVQIFSDRYFNFAHHVTAQYFAKNKKIKTFVYELAYKTTSPNKDMFSSVPSKYVPHGEDLRLIFNGGGAFPLELVDGDDLFVKDMFLTAITMFGRTGNPSSREMYGSQWYPANVTYFKKHNIKYIDHPAESDKVDSIDDFLKFWYSLPLKQVKLLRSDNEQKIKDMYYNPKENKCYIQERSDNDCINKINSIKFEDWIENDEYLRDYESIKYNDWHQESIQKEEL